MMTMTGMFHIILLSSADEQVFVSMMRDVVFKSPAAMQATRNTQSIQHELLKKRADVRAYVWKVRVGLVTDREYDFGENLERVQKAVEGAGVVSGLDIYTNIGEPE
jgi:hypothetical protein